MQYVIYIMCRGMLGIFVRFLTLFSTCSSTASNLRNGKYLLSRTFFASKDDVSVLDHEDQKWLFSYSRGTMAARLGRAKFCGDTFRLEKSSRNGNTFLYHHRTGLGSTWGKLARDTPTSPRSIDFPNSRGLPIAGTQSRHDGDGVRPFSHHPRFTGKVSRKRIMSMFVILTK